MPYTRVVGELDLVQEKLHKDGARTQEILCSGQGVLDELERMAHRAFHSLIGWGIWAVHNCEGRTATGTRCLELEREIWIRVNLDISGQ